MKILMTGATGLIGKELGKNLFLKGHELLILSRNAERAQAALPFPCRVIEGDLASGKLSMALPPVDVVIN
jgi:NAD dependent epimerase/dehydratase family enzyme